MENVKKKNVCQMKFIGNIYDHHKFIMHAAKP